MAYTFEALKAEYAHKWEEMSINNSRVAIAQQQAQKIISFKDRYLYLENNTGVPWYFIGLLHLRESNCNFKTHLHNGDPLTARTVHEPKGYPRTGKPPFTFEFSAIDALTKMGYTKITDWDIERIAFCLEKYNGFGYRARRVPSAYLWASTNQYTKGKFVRDGVFNANVVDQQLGAMAVLKCVLDLIQEKVETSIEPITDETPNTPTADISRPTNQEMRQASRKWRVTDLWQWIFGTSAVGTVGVSQSNNMSLGEASSYINTIKSFVNTYGAELFILLCIVALIAGWYIRKLMKDDVQEGRSTPSGNLDM